MRSLLLPLLLLIPTSSAGLPASADKALRRGDCEAAKLSLDGEGGLSAALGLASCGQLGALEDWLEEHPGESDLEGYGRLLIARALVDSDPAKAEAALEGVSLPGDAGLEVKLLRGRAIVGQDRSMDAREGLRALLGSSEGAEARFWLSVGAADRGDKDAAITTFKSVWSSHVQSPYSALAGERLNALGYKAPDYSTSEGRALALTRAENLIKAYRADEAVPLMEGIGEATGDTSAAWNYTLGYARFKARDNEGAVESWGKLDPLQQGAYGGVNLAFDYALATSRTGDYDAAADRYQKLTQLYPGTSKADFASFKIGYLDYDEGDLEAAIPALEGHLARVPGTSHADSAHWFIAWSHYRLGNLTEAEAWFDKLIRGYGSSGLSVGARYWKARIQGDRGELQAEREGLDAIIRGWPSNGYAWFAAERRGRSFEGLDGIQSFTPPALPESFVSANPDVAAGLALADAGLYEWSRERMVKGITPARNAGKSTILAMAHALIGVGAYTEAQNLARPYCGTPWGGSSLNVTAMTACYPRPEEPSVTSAAQRAGLEPLLPYAIMTAESALQPGVTSPAGARGLMQLMPYLGEELHGELLGGDYDPDRLYTPGYNAWLGTTELGRLHGQFSGGRIQPSLPLAIAGYNGGADAVARWVDAEGQHADGDRFTENIGYTETRQYVRRVLGFLMNYRWIYGD